MSGRRCDRWADRAGAPVRQIFLALLWATLLSAAAAHAEDLYSLDQRFGTIAFSVSHLGLFSSRGEFRRFDARLALDAGHPERTQISVVVDAASIDMPWQEAAKMLRGPDFFDVKRYPEIRFTSTSVEAMPSDRYVVRGLVEIRGVQQLLVLNARLVGRHPDPARGAEAAEFVVTGALQRSAFGMTADGMFISDKVNITIRARIELGQKVSAG
jgi:polyisoprenoid-binding protein YceI